MKIFRTLTVMMVLAAVWLASGLARAQEMEGGDKTLSPYFLVQGDADVDQFSLKSTTAQVNIAGVIADVLVTQVYKNDGKKPIEAIYVFPASTRAAVYGMKMTIGKRVIVARIEEKQKARADYEEAKQQGKSASLLEQQRPNVFQMNVANILPGDEIKVELQYTELLIPEDGVYEFVYPTVVGPRYTNKPEAGAAESDKWVQNPYLKEGEAAPYTFDISVELSAGLPIQDITCGTHKVDVAYDGPALATVKLDRSEKAGGNRDYILKYRLAGGKIQSGLLLYQGDKENFFLLMMQPPARVTDADIPPREYIFIVDVSGSMHGFPLDISKKLLSDLIGNLRSTDTFNVILFAGGSSVMSEKSLAATDENVARAINMIDNQQGGGGTELLPALKRALALPRTRGVSRTVVIATDGYVDVEKESFDLIRDNLNDANMFAFGIGSSVNRFLIEGMARAGQGEPFVVTDPKEAPDQAAKLRKLVQSPVLTNVKLDYGKFGAYDVQPKSVPDVLAQRPVIVFGKFKGNPAGEITVSGVTGKRTYKETFTVSDVKPLPANSALRYLWARDRIATLDDYNAVSPDDERVKEVTNLGLTYNLLTAYTSFVAIDSEVRLKDGQAVTVKQPLPLPQGVSNYAVGGSMMAGSAVLPSMTMRAKAGKSLSMPAAKPEEAETSPDYGLHENDKLKDAEKEQSARVSHEKLSVKGGITKADVETVVKQGLGAIEACYGVILRGQPGLSGKIVLRIEIKPDGSVDKVTVVSDGLNNADLEKCIIKTIKKWQFSPTADNAKASAAFTLILRP
ncbi:MAG TPA: TonB family protein [bacterium]|nr:TonB family protein [bacterium]